MQRWLILLSVALWWLIPPVRAETLKSSNYSVDESFIGGGGLINENSANFKAAESIGDAAIGLSNSTSFGSNSGYTTDNDPALTFFITPGPINFPPLSATGTATATSTFSVLNYTSFGYQVVITGGTPTNDGHSIPAPSAQTSSQVGTEQYGINLVHNVSPSTLGADPDNGNPTFGYGGAATGYDTANVYKYVAGDIIATAPRSSGKTNYTISYILNAAPLTPGGQYTTAHELICTGTY